MKYSCYLVLSMLLAFGTAQSQTVTVAQDGSGNFTTIKAAILAAPTTATLVNPYIIKIKNGYYFEKDTIPSNKPFIQLIGESSAKTILAFNAAAGMTAPSGGTYGTAGSATLTVNAPNFTAMNLTIANTFNYDSAATAGFAGTQAVAFQINADKAVFKNCVFLGFQDTLYTKGALNARHYFKSCYIDGTVDFIFGSSIDVFDSCIIYPKARPGGSTSYITAANTTIGQSFGYVFRDCKLPAHTGTTSYFLGRPWNNATAGITANNKVAFLNSTMGYSINPIGWSVWDAGTDTSVITDAEYKSKRFNGSLVDLSKRVSWSKQLVDTTGYNLFNMFLGWDPFTATADFGNYTQPEIVVANFKGVKGTSATAFTWNICWPTTGIVYDVYRSIDNKASFQVISSITASTDTSINFQSTDALPPAGGIYYYFVKASLASTAQSNMTDTVAVSSAPTVSTLGTLGGFIQSLLPPAPSAVQSYTVKGVNLVSDVTITPPANFEISADGGTTWFNNASPLVITHSADSIPTKKIQVRLNASVVGTWSGTITNTTTGPGFINANIPVVGQTIATALPNLFTIQSWPLTVDNNDDSTVRYDSVYASTTRFNKLYPSLGTGAAVPAYGTIFGQAFGASATKDGAWGTADGGPGGNLNRTIYEEFTIKSKGFILNNLQTIRLDTIVLNADFYNSSSNTKMAIVYSKDGFVSDSTELPGATFATPIVLNKNNTATTDNYRLAINGLNGFLLHGQSSFTFRIYMSCGSTSTGRYGMLKDVKVVGDIVKIVPLNLTNFTGTKKDNNVVLNWNTVNEVNTSYFTVERSINLHEYSPIATMDAASISGEHTYQFEDTKLPTASRVYYRLKMVDRDGKFAYSKIIAVEVKNSVSLQLYPNPVTNYIKLEHGPASFSSEFRILNAMGKQVLHFAPKVGTTISTIPVDQLISGNYFIQYINGNESYSLSFIKN